MHWFWGVLLSDVLTFFSFPPFPLGIVMLVGLVPLFIALEKASTWRSAFFRAWVYVFIGNSAICFWVGPTLEEFARVPSWISYPSIGLLSLLEQSAWPVMAALRFILHRRYGVRPLLWTPVCLVVLDYAWPKFFPNSMGNVFYSIPWLSQFADVFGVGGLTGLLVLTNEIVAAWLARTWSAQELYRHSAVTAGLVVAIFSYSFWRYHAIQQAIAAPVGHLKVSLIQPNLNPIALVRQAPDKHAARYIYTVPLLELSQRALSFSPDLIFWPETSVSNTYGTSDARETVSVTDAINSFARQSKTPLLFGARDRDGEDLYNSLFLIEPSATGSLAVQRYYKSRLLWLGEYVPLSSTFPAIADHIRRQGGTTFTPGKGAMTFQLGKYKLGPMICLEGLYADYVRDLAADADILVNATNDAWFGKGMEPPLHLYLTSFRAIENRRPLIRSTTTGHSAVIDIDGKMRLKTALGERGVFNESVPVYPKLHSLYRWWGNLPIALGFLYFAGWFFALRWRSRQPGK